MFLLLLSDLYQIWINVYILFNNGSTLLRHDYTFESFDNCMTPGPII